MEESPGRCGRRHGATAAGLVVFGGLARAVRKESNLAVAHWWGVTPQTVTVWRKSLGVQPANDGTRRLKCEYGQEPFFKRAQRKAWSKAQDPERRAKIAASKRGQKRPPHVLQILLAARLGSRHSAKTRRQMSETHLKRNAALRRAKSVEYR